MSVGTDIATLAKYANVPSYEELAAELFKQSISTVYSAVSNAGGVLVLRERTHADFSIQSEPPANSSLVSLLENDYDIRSVLTVRNPIDSYSSLVKNVWVSFKPSTFEEYCRRLLLLVNQYSEEQIFIYEEFLQSPKEKMQMITKSLQLPYDSSFEDTFGIFKVTGDSGRSADTIGERSRIAPESILLKSQKSESFLALKNLGLFKWT